MESNLLYWVSKTIPFLSNLSVAENIALILEYHAAFPTKKAIEMAMERLENIGFTETGHKREPYLSNQERFAAMFIRASITPGEIIIDRPFNLLENEKNTYFMNELFQKCDTFFTKITIFDFAWNQERYGELYG